MQNQELASLRRSDYIHGSGDILRIKRTAVGFSQRQMAILLGVCRRSLQNWEYNKRPVPILISNRLDKYYEDCVSDGDGDKNKCRD